MSWAPKPVRNLTFCFITGLRSILSESETPTSIFWVVLQMIRRILVYQRLGGASGLAPPWAKSAATRSSSSGLQWRGILGSLNSSGAMSVSSVTQEMHLPFRGPAEPRKWGPRGSDGAFSGGSGYLISLAGTLSTEVNRVPLLGWQSAWQGGEGACRIASLCVRAVPHRHRLY